MRFAGDPEIALDVLQETFLYLLSQFPPTGPGLTLTARLTSLLYPVAKHSAITLRRKANRYVGTVDADELPAPEPFREGDDAGDVQRRIAQLSEQRREVLLLRFVDDLTLDEIATALSVPLGTVKSRLHHAIRALKQDAEEKKTDSP